MIRFRNCYDVIKALTLLLLISIVKADDAEISPQEEKINLFKGYSGYRLFNDTLRMVYYHDLTLAVVEIARGRVLMNCELIEVFSDNQRLHALRNLTRQIGQPFELKFNEMMELMSQCDKLDDKLINQRIAAVTKKPLATSQDAEDPPQSSILSGIVPGTKWCGTGDIAKNYFDLGPDMVLDKCCRLHDLCPVKVGGSLRRYNLQNKAIYTKSHCSCDDELMRCLKSTGRSAANFMGNIYFNILRISCIVDEKDGKKKFRLPKPY